MTLTELLNKFNEDLKYYRVVALTKDNNVPIMCEDGEYRVRNGYAAFNTLSETYEHTTTLLPGVIFQAQHLDSMLDGLLNPAEQNYPALGDMPTEDVAPN